MPDYDALRKLEEAATPGPWTAVERDIIMSGVLDVAEAAPQPDDYDARQLSANAEFIAAARNALPQLLDELAELRAKLEAREDALRQIAQWADAYPLDVFPEPDFQRASALLMAGGITLDAISASNMRYVVKEVGLIAKTALAAQQEKE